MGNRRRHIGSSLAALTLTLSLLTGLLTGCGPGGSQSSSPEAGSTPPAASQSTQTPEQPALPELTTDTYGNAAVGYQAAVVSANEYTSRIGMDILEAGGNAVDAAVAMIFANSLTEPGATSLGGASFMTIYLKETGEYICIEAMETAPAAAGIDTLDEINEKKGAMLVTVPGQVHGALTALEKYGTMTREEVLAPVIQLAEEGFDVHISFEEPRPASTNWCRTRRRPRYLPTKACPMRWGTTSPTPTMRIPCARSRRAASTSSTRGASPRPSWTRSSAWAACSPWRIWPATPAWSGSPSAPLITAMRS